VILLEFVGALLEPFVLSFARARRLCWPLALVGGVRHFA
jgi:hypothetical protein